MCHWHLGEAWVQHEWQNLHLKLCYSICYLFQKPCLVLSLHIKVILHYYCHFLIFSLFVSWFSHTYWWNLDGKHQNQVCQSCSTMKWENNQLPLQSPALCTKHFHSTLILLLVVFSIHSLTCQLKAVRWRGWYWNFYLFIRSRKKIISSPQFYAYFPLMISTQFKHTHCPLGPRNMLPALTSYQPILTQGRENSQANSFLTQHKVV